MIGMHSCCKMYVMLHRNKVGFILYHLFISPSLVDNLQPISQWYDCVFQHNDTGLLQLKETMTDCCAYRQVLKSARASAKHDYIITSD
jgi:hypothetical protein